MYILIQRVFLYYIQQTLFRFRPPPKPYLSQRPLTELYAFCHITLDSSGQALEHRCLNLSSSSGVYEAYLKSHSLNAHQLSPSPNSTQLLLVTQVSWGPTAQFPSSILGVYLVDSPRVSCMLSPLLQVHVYKFTVP